MNAGLPVQPGEADDTAPHAADDTPQAPAAGMPPASPMEEDDGDVDSDALQRQVSWALPELPSAGAAVFTWGRSDMGQTGQGVESISAAALPQPVRTLRERAVAAAAGSAYNSAFVTRARPPRRPVHQNSLYPSITAGRGSMLCTPACCPCSPRGACLPRGRPQLQDRCHVQQRAEHVQQDKGGGGC